MKLDEKALEAAVEASRFGTDVRKIILAYEAAKPAPASEAVEARRAADAAGYFGGIAACIEDLSSRVHAAQAAIEPRPEAVTVKALEWEPGDGITRDRESWVAKTQFGDVYFVIEGQWWVGMSDARACSGDDEAKADAQADYEARIRSALATPAPAPAASGGLEVVRELVRASSALLGYLWQDVWSHERTHDENWKEFDRKYPGVKWLRDARDAALASLAATSGEPVAWTGHGSLRLIEDGFQGTLYGSPPSPEAVALYTHPTPAATSIPAPADVEAACKRVWSRAITALPEKAWAALNELPAVELTVIFDTLACAALAAPASAKVKPEGLLASDAWDDRNRELAAQAAIDEQQEETDRG